MNTAKSINAPRRMHGVTLLELLITLVIVAITLSLAVPNLRGMMSRNQLLGQANELAGALALARSEAVTRGSQAGVCASLDGATCNGSAGDWNQSLLVFLDVDNNSALDAGEPVLKVLSAHGEVSQAAGQAAFYFTASGFSTSATQSQIDVCHVDTAEHDRCRRVTIAPSGIVTVRSVEYGT